MLNGEMDDFLQEVLQRGTRTDLAYLMEGYRLCAQSEGKSANTIAIVEASVRYLAEFLETQRLSTNIEQIGPQELRYFIIDLQSRQRFAHHRFTGPQSGHLSGHTINTYLRSLRAFWSWVEAEGLVPKNPFSRITIPKAPKKVMPAFSEAQIKALMAAIDTSTREGLRNYAILLTLLDTGLRVSEFTNLRLKDVNLEGRLLKVWGKGAKERLVPIGARVQKTLWKYLTFYRPEPAMPRYDQALLTSDGRPLTNDRVEAIVKHYGTKAGINGVRVSPHTFRHTFAIMFLRNGGDVFSLQRIMGHATLDILRTYINMAQSDISQAHRRCSPADNIDLHLPPGKMKPKTNRRMLPKKKHGAEYGVEHDI